jgi:hypothetical protein
MSTKYEKLRTLLSIGFFAGAAAFASACGNNSGNDNNIVIPRPDGSATGGTGGEAGSGGAGATGGSGGETGGSGGAGGSAGSGGTGGATGGSGGAGGSAGNVDAGGSGGGGGMCQASGSYDNSTLPLLPDGGLPPL